MIKRTAQEWADFTGCELVVGVDAYSLHHEENIAICKENVSDFEEYEINQIIKPSEPHVLIPTRLLEEAGELIQRMNDALDGKIKEREEKRTPSGNIVEYVRCPHCNDILRLSVVKTCLSCGKPV